jgi:hypothetical protein
LACHGWYIGPASGKLKPVLLLMKEIAGQS